MGVPPSEKIEFSFPYIGMREAAAIAKFFADLKGQYKLEINLEGEPASLIDSDQFHQDNIAEHIRRLFGHANGKILVETNDSGIISKLPKLKEDYDRALSTEDNDVLHGNKSAEYHTIYR